MSSQGSEGRVVVVTGGSSGIGEAVARRFAEDGASVVVASRDLSRCQDVAREITVRGGQAIAVDCDVRKEESVRSLFDRTEESFGVVGVLVASAGISGGSKTVDEYSLDDWNRVMDTNLTGVFLTAREAFRRMKPRGGHIVIISSQAGIEGYAGKGAYSASKFGTRGLAHALGEEGRPHDINVSALCPGTVDTPILSTTGTSVDHPLTLDAVADAVIFLANLRGNSLVRDLVLERMQRG